MYPSDRLEILEFAEGRSLDDFKAAVEEGLTSTPKRLPCRFFYDAEGSRLFREITRLPEYYLPAAEKEIILEEAGGIAPLFPSAPSVFELGSGDGEKTAVLLEALLGGYREILYVPADIDRSILEACAGDLLAKLPGLRTRALACEYEAALERIRDVVPPPRLVLWLGSNVGNLDRSEAARFLGRLRGVLEPADRVLIGVDLRKARDVLERAYNDSKGITARFNLNLLARINRELGGRFDLERFRHIAFYNEKEGRIEMHIESRERQRVAVGALGLEAAFEAGERIHTENSYKYSPREIEALARAAGFDLARLTTDRQARFAHALLAPGRVSGRER